MTRTKYVCYLIAASQLALGCLYLFWPVGFIAWQGLGPIGTDVGYPLAMLAARFFVYGIGMAVIAQAPGRYRIWLDGMIAIQLIDLAAGAYYVSSGNVELSDAIIPMFNAALFVGLMIWTRPKTDPKHMVDAS